MVKRIPTQTSVTIHTATRGHLLNVNQAFILNTALPLKKHEGVCPVHFEKQ